jgi:large subunit ribosomal protein L2
MSNVIGLIKYSNGSVSSIKLAYGLNIGSIVKSSILPIGIYNLNLLGFRVFLHCLRDNMIFFDLGRHNSCSKYIRSNGTFSQVINLCNDSNLALILLPSGKKKYIKSNYLCTLGRNNNIFKKFLVTGKSGTNRNLGKNITVRGVAMNPVDHPHGGRTKTNSPEVSP